MGEALIALVALTAMEIVLGIDNIVFITIVTGRLPESQRPHAWRMGLGLALVLRILLLLTLSWILSLDEPVFTLESLGIRGEWFYDSPAMPRRRSIGTSLATRQWRLLA